MVEDTPYFLRRKCCPKNLVFSDVSLMAILAEVTENECIIERHLCDPCKKRSEIVTDRERQLQHVDSSFSQYKAFVGISLVA